MKYLPTYCMRWSLSINTQNSCSTESWQFLLLFHLRSLSLSLSIYLSISPSLSSRILNHMKVVVLSIFPVSRWKLTCSRRAPSPRSQSIFPPSISPTRQTTRGKTTLLSLEVKWNGRYLGIMELELGFIYWTLYTELKFEKHRKNSSQKVLMW